MQDRIGPILYDESKKQLKWYVSTGRSIDDILPYLLSSLITMNMPNLRDFMLQLTQQNSLDAAIRAAAIDMGKAMSTIEEKNAVPLAFSSITDNEWKYFISGILKILHCKECTDSYSENMMRAYSASTDFEAVYQRTKQAFSNDAQLFTIF